MGPSFTLNLQDVNLVDHFYHVTLGYTFHKNLSIQRTHASVPEVLLEYGSYNTVTLSGGNAFIDGSNEGHNTVYATGDYNLLVDGSAGGGSTFRVEGHYNTIVDFSYGGQVQWAVKGDYNSMSIFSFIGKNQIFLSGKGNEIFEDPYCGGGNIFSIMGGGVIGNTIVGFKQDEKPNQDILVLYDLLPEHFAKFTNDDDGDLKVVFSVDHSFQAGKIYNTIIFDGIDYSGSDVTVGGISAISKAFGDYHIFMTIPV
jgi:hypothetical protein